MEDLGSFLVLCCVYGICLVLLSSTDLLKPLFWTHHKGCKTVTGIKNNSHPEAEVIVNRLALHVGTHSAAMCLRETGRGARAGVW